MPLVVERSLARGEGEVDRGDHVSDCVRTNTPCTEPYLSRVRLCCHTAQRGLYGNCPICVILPPDNLATDEVLRSTAYAVPDEDSATVSPKTASRRPRVQVGKGT